MNRGLAQRKRSAFCKLAETSFNLQNADRLQNANANADRYASA